MRFRKAMHSRGIRFTEHNLRLVAHIVNRFEHEPMSGKYAIYAEEVLCDELDKLLGSSKLVRNRSTYQLLGFEWRLLYY